MAGGIPIIAIMATAATAATAVKASYQIKAAESQEKALDVAAGQKTIEAQQKSLANMDLIEKTIAAQTAAASGRGYALSSPSFNAIQRETVNTGARRQKNIELEAATALSNIALEKQNVKRSLFANLFGDVASLGMNIGSLYQGQAKKKLPSMDEQ